MSADPTISVQVDWTTDPGPDPTTGVWATPSAWTTLPKIETISRVDRGRAYEQDEVQTGTLAAAIDNSDATLTPERVPNVKTYRAVRVSVTPPAPYDGTTYGLFNGYLTDFQADPQVGLDYARLNISAVDALDPLGQIELRSTYAQEVLADDPIAYYPAGDAAGSTTLANVSTTMLPNGKPANGGQLVYGRGIAGGQYSSGDPAMVAADPATSLDLAPATTGSPPFAAGGWKVDLLGSSRSTAPILQPTGGFDVECWFTAGSSVQSGAVIFEQFGPISGQQIRVYVDFTGIYFFMNSATQSVTAFAAGAWGVDLKPHHLVCALRSDARTLGIIVDGVSPAGSYTTFGTTYVSANPVVAPAVFGDWPDSPSLLQWAGQDDANAAGWYWSGRLAHMALYNYQVAGTRFVTHYQAAAGFPGELSGTRIGRILDYAGVPSASRAVDAGRSTIGTAQLAGVKAKDALFEVATIERGLFFIDGSGRHVFHDRSHRMSSTSRVTFDGDTLPYEAAGLLFDYDPQHLLNDLTASRPGGATVRVYDAASAHQNFPRADTMTLNVGSDTELTDVAYDRVGRYSQAKTRVGSITLDPVTAPALWPWALGLEIGDRITLSNLPSSAPASTLDFIVESVTPADITPLGSFKVTFGLSPAEFEDYFVIEDATYGAIEDPAGPWPLAA